MVNPVGQTGPIRFSKHCLNHYTTVIFVKSHSWLGKSYFSVTKLGYKFGFDMTNKTYINHLENKWLVENL